LPIVSDPNFCRKGSAAYFLIAVRKNTKSVLAKVVNAWTSFVVYYINLIGYGCMIPDISFDMLQLNEEGFQIR